MTTTAAAANLLDDWKARRERLAGLPEPRGQVAELHLDLLDYLIRRATRPRPHAPPATRCRPGST